MAISCLGLVIAMKMKMMVIIMTAFAGGITQAQDWSWTFQRWGTTCGLLFEATNLTTSAKAAIRDDIAKVYATVPTSLQEKEWRHL
jgi:hypothetical protein